MQQDNRLYLLHLSDIHLGTSPQAKRYRSQLESDLKNELKVNRLHYLIISGDIANRSTKEEYDAAFEFVDGLVKRFGLDSSRVVIVPGNHDLNWDLSKQAYQFTYQADLPNPLPEGEYIPAGDAGALVRDENLYGDRFNYFSEYFYKKAYLGTEYPKDYSQQSIIHECPEDKILFLALNSCWQLDHHYKSRASINSDAIANAIDKILEKDYRDWLKIAVWHHPIAGQEAMNNNFLQQLAVNGFQICMHGHIHEAIEDFYKYDQDRKLHIIGAGTFGAPTHEQVTGIPLQYNLLCIEPETQIMTVETRKKEKVDGAWKADSRWGDANNPQPRYEIELHSWRAS
jgi:UDP-2,3-diacylglucosamine pyrophosphatase LpxH